MARKLTKKQHDKKLLLFLTIFDILRKHTDGRVKHELLMEIRAEIFEEY